MNEEKIILNEDDKWILSRIKDKERRNRDRPVVYRDIWQGCYDVYNGEEDMHELQRIPKERTEKAENNGLIKKEEVKWNGYKLIKYKLTEKGERLLELSGGAYWQ